MIPFLNCIYFIQVELADLHCECPKCGIRLYCTYLPYTLCESWTVYLHISIALSHVHMIKIDSGHSSSRCVVSSCKGQKRHKLRINKHFLRPKLNKTSFSPMLIKDACDLSHSLRVQMQDFRSAPSSPQLHHKSHHTNLAKSSHRLRLFATPCSAAAGIHHAATAAIAESAGHRWTL